MKMSRGKKNVTRRMRRSAPSGGGPKVGALALTAKEERIRLGQSVNPFNMVPQKVETKFLTTSISNQQLYHNLPRTMLSGGTTDLLVNITSGTANYNRLGTSVYLKRYHARLLLNNKADRPNVTYRFALIAVVNSTATDDLNELYAYPPSNALTGFFDAATSMVVYDKIIAQPSGPISNGITGIKERSTYVELDIPINQTATWAFSVGGTNQRVLLYPILVAYDSWGTLTTDNIASFQLDAQLTFSDV